MDPLPHILSQRLYYVLQAQPIFDNRPLTKRPRLHENAENHMHFDLLNIPITHIQIFLRGISARLNSEIISRQRTKGGGLFAVATRQAAYA